MLSAAALAIADSYWAAFFGCGVDELRPRAAWVGPHAGLGDAYPGVYLMELGAAPVVSAPPTLSPEVRARMSLWEAGTVRRPRLVRETLGLSDALAVGPAYVGYAERVRPVGGGGAVRVLAASEVGAVAALREACSPKEWDHGGSMPGGGEPVIGSFTSGGELAALAGYKRWDGRIAHISVVTHPAHRGRGHASAAAAALARLALERGLLPQYRTLESNAASLAVGRGLGFVEYATSLAVRRG